LHEVVENRGQSLVETALFLPILIFMLAGIVEVSNLLITQNRVTTSSRMAAGFGAANFDHENWADDTTGTAYDMGIVALNTITESMPLNPDQWDIYSAHGLTAQDGLSFDIFESEWVYGNHTVVSDAEWTAMEGEIEARILESLQSECPGDTASCAGNVEFVVSVPFHNLDTILGLPVWQWTGFERVRGMTVMRVRPVVQAQGCAILPIAVRLDQFSLYPTNWPDNQYPFAYSHPPDPVDLFPSDEKRFELPKKDHENNNQTPDPMPTYVNLSAAPSLNPNAFLDNQPGIPLWDVITDKSYLYTGAIFWARDLGASGNFGWLSWNGDGDEPTLVDSIVDGPPGNFVDVYPGSRADKSEDDRGNPFLTSHGSETGNGDGILQPGEWIEGATGNMAQQTIRALYYPYVKDQWEVAILVFGETDPGASGSQVLYKAYGFITVRVLGMGFGTNDKWILFEFVDSAVKCQ
jgi:hypothetical protein